LKLAMPPLEVLPPSPKTLNSAIVQPVEAATALSPLRAHMLVPCATVTESVVAVTLPLNESDPKLPTGWALVLTAPPVLFFQQ
jgi:hypothetical protein